MALDYDLAVVGAGCAGLAAGVYGGRAGMRVVVFDKGKAGGQLLITPHIENYIAFKSIAGVDLAQRMLEHAQEYSEVREFEPVESVAVAGDHVVVTSSGGTVTAAALLITTGAEHKHLDVPGEDRLAGKGVSYCATCDGFFFKGRRVITVGGGSTAAIDALYLKGIDVDVSIVHRRGSLRAESALREEITRQGIPVIYDSVIEEILGERKVERVRMRRVDTGALSELPVEGVFVAVGQRPNNELVDQLGLEKTPDGLVRVDPVYRTSNPRVFAAGDLIGGVRQAITAAAAGTVASLNVLPLVGKQYPW
jgi:thioredoxin reductase (NADPH)